MPYKDKSFRVWLQSEPGQCELGEQAWLRVFFSPLLCLYKEMEGLAGDNLQLFPRTVIKEGISPSF